jgi:hypothetical protein
LSVENVIDGGRAKGEEHDHEADHSRRLRRNNSGTDRRTGRSLRDRRQGRRLRATTGNTGQTVGTASTSARQHPPTGGLNQVAGTAATSSEHAQKQMQGQPTAAQQAQGVQPSAKMADRGC